MESILAIDFPRSHSSAVSQVLRGIDFSVALSPRSPSPCPLGPRNMGQLGHPRVSIVLPSRSYLKTSLSLSLTMNPPPSQHCSLHMHPHTRTFPLFTFLFCSHISPSNHIDIVLPRKVVSLSLSPLPPPLLLPPDATL